MTGYSQNLSVRVVSKADGSPVCYSYVYVNGKVFAVADSVGLAVIPISRLTTGDTLSASFVGMKGDPVVYDDSMRKAGRCELLLMDAYSTDEVIVRPDGRKMYLKYVREKPFLTILSRLDAGFELSGRLSDGREFSVEGTVAMGIHMAMGGGFKIMKLKTKSDTVGLKGVLYCALILQAIDYVWATMHPVKNSDWNGITSTHIDYNGCYKDIRFFTTCLKREDVTVQTLLKVDAETHRISSMEINFLNHSNLKFRKSVMSLRPYKYFLWLDGIETEGYLGDNFFKIRMFDTHRTRYFGDYKGYVPPVGYPGAQ